MVFVLANSADPQLFYRVPIIWLWPCCLAITSTGRVGLRFLWFYVQEHRKAQLLVVLILKHLRRGGHSLKSHLTDWEKPGIEPATPGLQDIGLSPTPQWPIIRFSISLRASVYLTELQIKYKYLQKYLQKLLVWLHMYCNVTLTDL